MGSNGKAPPFSVCAFQYLYPHVLKKRRATIKSSGNGVSGLVLRCTGPSIAPANSISPPKHLFPLTKSIIVKASPAYDVAAG